MKGRKTYLFKSMDEPDLYFLWEPGVGGYEFRATPDQLAAYEEKLREEDPEFRLRVTVAA